MNSKLGIGGITIPPTKCGCRIRHITGIPCDRVSRESLYCKFCFCSFFCSIHFDLAYALVSCSFCGVNGRNFFYDNIAGTLVQVLDLHGVCKHICISALRKGDNFDIYRYIAVRLNYAAVCSIDGQVESGHTVVFLLFFTGQRVNRVSSLISYESILSLFISLASFSKL